MSIISTINRHRSFWGGIDANTVLMLHLDGADEATSTTDSSSSGHTVTMVTASKLDDAQTKFGTTSGYNNGSTGHIDVTSSSEFDFGTGDFCFDAQLYFNTGTSGASRGIFSRYTDSNNYWEFGWIGASSLFRMTNNIAGSVTNKDFAFSETEDVWFHTALDRSGSDLKVFIDGTQAGSTLTFSESVTKSGATLDFGHAEGVGSIWNGWIDEVRFSDVSRYSGNFTPPTQAYI